MSEPANEFAARIGVLALDGKYTEIIGEVMRRDTVTREEYLRSLAREQTRAEVLVSRIHDLLHE